MTDIEMQNAISEECENKDLNYVTDLNAMHQAEKTIEFTRVPRYIYEIWEAMRSDGRRDEMGIGTVHATAKQRGRAFLKTIGKWKD
jgi:hypothetical protein